MGFNSGLKGLMYARYSFPFFGSHTNGSADLLHSSQVPHFKTFRVLKYDSVRQTQLNLFINYYSSSSTGATARCGLWPVEQYLSIFPIYHQLSPSSHSQHLKISFCFFSPSFPGSSSSSRPFQFLSADLFGHPILLHSLHVTQPTYPLPLYPFYYIFSFTHLF